MSRFRPLLLAFLLIGCTACRKDKAASRLSSSPMTTDSPSNAPSRYAATGWPEDAGPVLVIPGANSGEVRLVLPELTDSSLSDTSSFDLDSLPGQAVDLFALDGRMIAATIAAGGSEELVRGCHAWPAARLTHASALGWRFGLARDVAEPIKVQQWGENLRSDSTAALSSIVAFARASSTDSVFSGIPFSPRYLAWLDVASSRVAIADVMRRINTEANAREEHVLVVAERANGSSQYRVAFRWSTAGAEDRVPVPELLGAVAVGEKRRPMIFFSVDYSDGVRLMSVERAADNRWVRRWQSAYAGC